MNIVALRCSVIAATPEEVQAVIEAANQVLAFERWARANPRSGTRSARHYPGRTAAEVIDGVTGGNVMRWAQLATVSLDLCKQIKGVEQ